MSDTNSKGLLTADDVEALLVADDLVTVDVFVPEWKKTVRLRQLTAAESIAIADSGKKAAAVLVAMSIVDEKNNRLFKEPERLGGKSAGAMNLLAAEALKLNGLFGSAAAAVAAAVAAKNG